MKITQHGYQAPTVEEITAQIAQAQKNIFPDLVLDHSSPDQQLNGLMAEAIIVGYELAAGIYNGLDPRTASGIMLDRVSLLTGTKRREARPSRSSVALNGAPGAKVPKGTRLSASSIPGSEYNTEWDAVIGSKGVGIVAIISTKSADEDIPAGAVDTIETPVNGLNTVSNPAKGQNGRERETDSHLRVRRELTLASRSTGILESIYAGLYSTTGVKQARVFENSTDTVDTDGIPPHSIMCIVDGGKDEDIINAIMTKKSLGAGTHGSITKDWIDSHGFGHVTKFSRPIRVPIFVKVTVDKKTPQFESDIKSKIWHYIENLKNNEEQECASGQLGIADDVHASIIYPALFKDNPGYNVLDIDIGKTAAVGANFVPIGKLEISSFTEANIEVV